jgi:hypothetical protein
MEQWRSEKLILRHCVSVTFVIRRRRLFNQMPCGAERRTMENIAIAIEEYTASISNFDERRDYVSLSHVHLGADELVAQFQGGFQDGRDVRLKCYKGYQMEKDLVSRIRAVFGNRISDGGEISAFGGLVKGHPDFLFDGYPADCKSVLMDEWLPKDGKLSRRIYWQMQGYMKYAGKEKSLVIFESRENGRLVHIWVRPNLGIQNDIESKLQEVVKRIAPQGRAIK